MRKVIPSTSMTAATERHKAMTWNKRPDFRAASRASWNLRLSARDGFLPWVIVGSVAPRHVVHAHEFAWDKDKDPVWKRYQKIWGDFYGAGDHLGVAHGKGLLKGQPPEASHCTNIGKFHRRMR